MESAIFKNLMEALKGPSTVRRFHLDVKEIKPDEAFKEIIELL
jgi:hypothetical protein